MKKSLSVVLSFSILIAIILAFGTFNIFAYDDSFDEEALEDKISSVYSEIREERGYSYSGYCGTFLIHQLRELKIGYLSNGGSLNGNKWFVNLKEGVTAYGYSQIKYPGNGCLYDIIEANEGKDVYNIVISFTYQYGYSYEKPGAGHALLIYAISDGNVYFTENFTFDGIPEGGMIKLSITEFYERFNADYGNAIGAVHFVNKEKEITDKIEAVYTEVKNQRSEYKDFVTAQLDTLGIGFLINNVDTSNGDICGALESWGLTSKGYVQKKYSGTDSIDRIIADYNSDLSDVVVSFGNSEQYHSVYIYGLLGDKLYFVEEAEHFGNSSGDVIKMTVEDFCGKYSSLYGEVTGAVKFIKTDREGYITLKNLGAGRLLNIYDDRNIDGTSVTVFRSDSTTGQFFKVVYADNGFKLYSLCAPEKELGLNDSGKAIIAKDADSSLWFIEKVNAGYIIRLSSDPDKVLMSSGNYNSARVVVGDYVEGNRFQIWSFSDASIDELLKCYKVTFNADGKINDVYCSYGEVPVAPRVTDFVTNSGISYFDAWDRELSPVTGDCEYTANYRFVAVEYDITWDVGGEKQVEKTGFGEVPSYGDGVMYDKLPTEVYSEAEYKVYRGAFDEVGSRYYFGDEMLTGWQILNGEKRYFSKVTGYMITNPTVIDGVKYHFNADGTLKSGFFEEDGGTRYYSDGVMMTRFVEIEGKTYYFLATTGLMIKEKTYRIGGYLREFNDDHSLKPINGWQEKSGEKYYFINGEAVTGFTEIDGDSYYFMRSDDVYGRAATKWVYIGNKIFYFYATTSETPFILKKDGAIGGIEYEYSEEGWIVYNGFVNCDYANSVNNNSAQNIQMMNGTTRYYINGEMQTGWQYINGNWYYFYAMGSANGSGYMCVQSRKIGGVWYEFTSEGVCLNKT